MALLTPLAAKIPAIAMTKQIVEPLLTAKKIVSAMSQLLNATI